MSKNLFITGTGTDVGKTYVTGLIAKKLWMDGNNSAYYKAAMSGCQRKADGSLIPGDAEHVKSVSGIAQPLKEMCSYIYEEAVSPHLASLLEHKLVDMEVIKNEFYNLSQKYEYITMEGSGGIVCPICFEGKKILLEDIIKELNLSTLIVADAGLGTINSVVLTVEYMKSRNIPIQGLIFNNFHPGNIMEEDNLKMCENLTGVKVLSRVKKGDVELEIDIEVLKSLYQ